MARVWLIVLICVESSGEAVNDPYIFKIGKFSSFLSKLKKKKNNSPLVPMFVTIHLYAIFEGQTFCCR